MRFFGNFLWGEAAEGRPSLLESWGKLLETLRISGRCLGKLGSKLMESRRISKKLLGNLLGKLRIFFQNALGILGETLGVFGEILVKVS